jgi:hypothetical protein
MGVCRSRRSLEHNFAIVNGENAEIFGQLSGAVLGERGRRPDSFMGFGSSHNHRSFTVQFRLSD